MKLIEIFKGIFGSKSADNATPYFDNQIFDFSTLPPGTRVRNFAGDEFVISGYCNIEPYKNVFVKVVPPDCFKYKAEREYSVFGKINFSGNSIFDLVPPNMPICDTSATIFINHNGFTERVWGSPGAIKLIRDLQVDYAAVCAFVDAPNEQRKQSLPNMEPHAFYKVGESVAYDSALLKVCVSNGSCRGCYFRNHEVAGCNNANCRCSGRKDGQSVIFKEVMPTDPTR